MASTGTVTLAGKLYTWHSPTIGDLAQFEALNPDLRIQELSTISSTRGRVQLACICLQRDHPELTPGAINDLPAQELDTIWDMLLEALPLISRWFRISRPPAGEAANQAAQTQETSTSSPSPDSSAGLPPKPDEKA
jgi:hypothetical protein